VEKEKWWKALEKTKEKDGERLLIDGGGRREKSERKLVERSK
jgi:hypothetical protein